MLNVSCYKIIDAVPVLRMKAKEINTARIVLSRGFVATLPAQRLVVSLLRGGGELYARNFCPTRELWVLPHKPAAASLLTFRSASGPKLSQKTRLPSS